MAKRKLSRKYSSRARRRTMYRRRRRLTAQGVPSGLPVIRIAKLRYCDTFTLQSPVGALAEYMFRANSVFDPNSTAGGHQPMGFDQWAALYNHYVVKGSKINVRIMHDTGSGTDIAVRCGVYLTDGSSSGYTDATEFIEARKGHYRNLGNGADKAVRMNLGYSTRKFFNITNVKDNVGRLGAAVTANPTEQAYYAIWVQSASSNSETVNVTAVIDYIVEFSEPKDLSQS